MKPGTLEEFATLKAMAPLRVLIVGHSPDDVELIHLQLREAGLRFDYVTAENREQFRRALGRRTSTPSSPTIAFPTGRAWKHSRSCAKPAGTSRFSW